VYLAIGGPLLAWVYEDAYRSGATILAILSVGRLVHVCTGSAAITLSMTGFQGALVRITLVTSLLTVFSAYTCGRLFGASGVAWAITTGVIVQNVAAWWVARLRTGMWTHIGIPRPSDLRGLFR
jgi:O-antigen/teichoic acid export membrane protein